MFKWHVSYYSKDRNGRVREFKKDFDSLNDFIHFEHPFSFPSIFNSFDTFFDTPFFSALSPVYSTKSEQYRAELENAKEEKRLSAEREERNKKIELELAEKKKKDEEANRVAKEKEIAELEKVCNEWKEFWNAEKVEEIQKEIDTLRA